MTSQPSGRRRLRPGEGPTGAELKTLYDTGVTIRQIAKALGGWPYTTVRQRLAQAGTKFRPRGGRRVPPPDRDEGHPETAQ